MLQQRHPTAAVPKPSKFLEVVTFYDWHVQTIPQRACVAAGSNQSRAHSLSLSLTSQLYED